MFPKIEFCDQSTLKILSNPQSQEAKVFVLLFHDIISFHMKSHHLMLYLVSDGNIVTNNFTFSKKLCRITNLLL